MSDIEQHEEQKIETLETPGVIDKYKDAAKIANLILEKVIKLCTENKNIVEICSYADKEIELEVQKVYSKKKNMEKGIAFPTCISVNNICGHYSPLPSESYILKKGDVAKIDLGVHIDGYISLVGHTVVIGEAEVTGRKADVILAAYNALESAYRLLKPGNKNNDVTKAIKTICDSYKCTPLEGVLSHEVKRHLIDGNNVIINKEDFDQKVEEHEFQVNEVYVLDIIVSTGEGKTKYSDFRTTVFKRAIERAYNLKTKSAKQFFKELNMKAPSLCFSMRMFEDEITTKLGIKECLEHELLNGYPVFVEQPNEIVAQFKATVMILGNRTLKISGLEIDQTKYKTDNKITDEKIVELLTQKMDKIAQKQQKKKKNKEPKEEKKEEKKE